MTLTLEDRIRLIEDREQIRELVANYCFLIDDGRFDELVDRCFTADASCDYRGVRGGLAPIVAQGSADIRNFLSAVLPGLLSDMVHTIHNHRISLDGDRGSGELYFWMTAIDCATGDDVIAAGRYFDRYRRVGGQWRFEVRNARIFFIAPIKTGWSKQRFLSSLADGSADIFEGEIHGVEGSNWNPPLDPFSETLSAGGAGEDPEDAGSGAARFILGKCPGT